MRWFLMETFSMCPLLLMTIAFFLRKENRRRDAFSENQVEDHGYIDEVQADGTVINKTIDVAFMDLTDRENKNFRCVSCHFFLSIIALD